MREPIDFVSVAMAPACEPIFLADGMPAPLDISGLQVDHLPLLPPATTPVPGAGPYKRRLCLPPGNALIAR